MEDLGTPYSLKPYESGENKDLRAAMQQFVAAIAEDANADPRELAKSFAKEDRRLLVPLKVIASDSAPGGVQVEFTTVVGDEDRPVLHVYTEQEELPALQERIMPAPMEVEQLITDLMDEGFQGMMVDPNAPHSVTFYFMDKGYALYSTQKLMEAGE